jgi:metal-responsive CopG/Arc/MetJ family transcriptional regulator
MRINTVLTDDLIKKIDAAAREQKKSRSKFIREASERYLAEYKREKEEEMRLKKFASAARIQDRLRKKGKAWDGVAEIRKWRGKVA